MDIFSETGEHLANLPAEAWKEDLRPEGSCTIEGYARLTREGAEILQDIIFSGGCFVLLQVDSGEKHYRGQFHLSQYTAEGQVALQSFGEVKITEGTYVAA